MRLDMPLKQEMSEILPALADRFDLQVTDDRYAPESFGNSYVTLQSPRIMVRFVRDRGQVWVEVAPLSAPAAWWPLALALEAIGVQLPETQFDLRSAAALLCDNFQHLAEALGPGLSDTRGEIERRAEERVRAWQAHFRR